MKPRILTAAIAITAASTAHADEPVVVEQNGYYSGTWVVQRDPLAGPTFGDAANPRHDAGFQRFILIDGERNRRSDGVDDLTAEPSRF